MDGCYAECYVHKEKTGKDMLKKFSVVGLMIAFALITIFFVIEQVLMIALVTFAIFAIFLFLTMYLVPKFNVDWEYVFVDGQLDFDMILGGEGRKRKLRIDFDDCEIIAPSESHHLDEYNNKPMRTLDYSSLSGAPNYTIIWHEGSTFYRILFEPDEEMVKTMRNKSPRKVKKD